VQPTTCGTSLSQRITARELECVTDPAAVHLILNPHHNSKAVCLHPDTNVTLVQLAHQLFQVDWRIVGRCHCSNLPASTWTVKRKRASRSNVTSAAKNLFAPLSRATAAASCCAVWSDAPNRGVYDDGIKIHKKFNGSDRPTDPSYRFNFPERPK